MQRICGTAAALLLVLVAVASASDEAETPAQKVVKMLAKLKKDVSAEGKTEEKDFEAYAKFCAKTQNEKEYQISRSEKKIAKAEADVGVLSEDAKTLGSNLVKLDKERTDLEDQLSKATAARVEEVEAYKTAAQEIDDALTALDRATKSIATAKDNLVGLAAMKKVANKVLNSAATLSLLELSASQISALDAFNAGTPSTTYNYRSSDVVSMLRGLKSTFAANKQTLDMQEEEASGTFNKLKMNLHHQLKYLKEDIDEKTLTKSKKDATIARLQKDLAAEESTKTADMGFLKSLKGDCSEKAEIAAERKTKREEELTAIDTAIAQLAKGGVQLVQKAESVKAVERRSAGVQVQEKEQTKEVKKEAVEAAPVKKAARTFLQIRESSKAVRTNKGTKKERAIALLEQVEAKVQLPSLALAVERVKGQQEPTTDADALAEVRKLIKTMIGRMEEAASEDATTNTFCDEQVTKHTGDRDNFKAEVETLSAEIDAKNASLRQTEKEVDELYQDVSELTTELDEATKLRSEESAANEAARKEAKEGEDATNLALSTLNAFYKNSPGSKTADLLQVQQAPDAEAMRKKLESATALNDDATTQRSGGVLAMLQVLAAEFSKTYAAVGNEEAKATEDFTKYKSDSQSDLKSKSGIIAEKTSEVSTLQVELDTAKTNLDAAQENLELALGELDKLKGMCTEGEESAEVRRLRREEEINLLKQTIGQLDEMMEAGETV